MSVMTVIKKIGDRIVSIVEWPIKHAEMVEQLITTTIEDEPEAKAAIVGLVEQFDAIGADTVADIASNGLNVAQDLKTAADVKALFAYFEATFKPAIEKAYGDLKADLPAAPAPTPQALATAPAPGLAATVAA